MRNELLLRLLHRDGADSWFRLAIQSSLGEGAGEFFAMALGDQKLPSGTLRGSELRRTKHGVAFMEKLARQIGTAKRKHEAAALYRGIGQLPKTESALAQRLIRSYATGLPAAERKSFLAGGSGQTRRLMAALLTTAKKNAADPKAKVNDRVAAVRTLGLSEFADVQKLFRNLLQLQQPQAVQLAVLETCGRFDDPQVATFLLDVWPGLSPRLRSPAAETLFSRTKWIAAFFDAYEKKQIARGSVDTARIQFLKSHPDAGIRRRAAKLLTTATAPKRQKVVAAYREALKLKGRVEIGRAVFKKNCTACHRLENVGTAVGADLKAVRDRGLESVMLNILDPNREVKPKFLAYIVVTESGRLVTGMIVAETANSITIRNVDGKSTTVLRSEIEQLKSTGRSFMPEGLEKTINTQAMADLLAYLNSIR